MAPREDALHYDLLFDGVRKEWDEHPDDCASLRFFWFGRKGGVSCPSDLMCCDDCSVWFYNEGMVWPNIDRDDEDEIWVCGCCATKRGLVVKDFGTYVSMVDRVEDSHD